MDENLHADSVEREKDAVSPETSDVRDTAAAVDTAVQPEAAVKKKKRYILIAAAIAVVLLVVVGIVLLSSGGGAEAAAEKFIESFYTDEKKAESMYAYDVHAYILYGGATEEEFFELAGDEYDADITSWNDYYKAVDTYWQEHLEDEFGEGFKITAEATKTRDKSVKKLFEEKPFAVQLEEKGLFDRDQIKDVKEVTVKRKITGEDSIERAKYTVYMVKIDSGWKVLTLDYVSE